MDCRMDKVKQSWRKKLEIPEHKRKEIREAFVLFDTDKDEHISYHELKIALRSLGFEMKRENVVKMLASYEQGGESQSENKSLSYDDFFDIVADLLSEQDPHEEIVHAFRLLDDDQTGKISLRNLRRVVRELGEQLTDEEMRAMIEEFDKDGDGEINLDEFTEIMTGETDDE